MTSTFPSRIDHDTAAYWDGAANRQLLIAQCNDCKHWIHPPRSCCPSCWSDNISHNAPSGKATLYSFTVEYKGKDRSPLIMAWAELEEQPRLIVVGPIVGISPDAVKIGSQLNLEWMEYGDTWVPSFRQEACA